MLRADLIRRCGDTFPRGEDRERPPSKTFPFGEGG